MFPAKNEPHNPILIAQKIINSRSQLNSDHCTNRSRSRKLTIYFLFSFAVYNSVLLLQLQLQIFNYFYRCTKTPIIFINTDHNMNKRKDTCIRKHFYNTTSNTIIHSLMTIPRFLDYRLLSTDILQFECPCPFTLK
jgi:hypothetical protein